MSALLSVRNLSAGYGRGPNVLEDVSFELGEGEALGLVGASGSGKTTIARIVAGLVPHRSGTIEWGGSGTAQGRRCATPAVGMVFQDPQSSLNPRLPIWEAVTEADWLRGAKRPARRDKAAALLEQVALGSEIMERMPHALSGGQRQRVAIARALCSEPPLLILDEPTSALDVTIQAQVLDLLSRLRQSLGLAFLFVTHDLHVVRKACDRLIVLETGRIVESGSAEQILTAAQHPYARRLAAATPSLHRKMDLAAFADAAETGEESRG